MLPVIKNKVLPSIETMHNIALRYIFDRPDVSIVDMRALEEGITVWSKKTDLNPEDRWELKRIVNALIADEKGHFDRSKMLQKLHSINYRQLYKAGLPFVDVDNRKFFNKG